MHGMKAAFAVFIALTIGLFTRTPTVALRGTAPAKTAIAYQAMLPSQTAVTTTSSSSLISASATVKFWASSSDQTVPAQQTPAPSSSTFSKITDDKALAHSKNMIAQPRSSPAIKSVQDIFPEIITAEWLLNQTTLSLTQKIDGAYKVGLTTNVGVLGTFSWDLLSQTIGGTGGIPQFRPSFSCTDPPDIPSPDANDQNPSFAVRTAYVCNIALTALTGNDKRTQTKQFSFQTGPGRVIVGVASNVNTVLQDGQNEGGFVFNNQDTEPVTITNLTLQLSFTALSTSSSPLVVRFINPKDNSLLAESHMENLPGDPSSSYTHSGTNIAVPISFTIDAQTQKLLVADIFGVQKYAFNGINPAVTVVMQSITATPSDVKITLANPHIVWSCIVPTGFFDPNATSSPFMMGTACRN